MQQKLARGLTAALLVAALSPAAAHAHGTAEMILGSTADSAGALALDFEFESVVVRVPFTTALGPVSFYSDIIPAIEPIAADDVTIPLYVLDASTQVTMEITAIDEGAVSVKIGPTTLAAVGDTAVVGTMPIPHTHPTYQLALNLPEGEFGEGRVSFKLTATGPTTYAESEIYTLRISNGPLPVIAYDTASEDKSSTKCLATVSKAVAKFVSAKHKLLAKCMDKVQAWQAKAALLTPPGNLASAEAAAEKACADASGAGPDSATMLGRIDAARAKAFTTIQTACGASGSSDLSDDDISAHLGLAGCRVEEIVSATYGTGREPLEDFTTRATQGGDPVSDHLPCMNLTATE